MNPHAVERRRQDPVSLLRRAFYGFLLAACAPCSASDAHGWRQTWSNWTARLPLQLGASLSPPQQPAMFMNMPNAGTALRLLPDSAARLVGFGAPPGNLSIDEGLGLAVAMPDMGALYVNVFCTDGDNSPGQWSFGDSLSTYRGAFAPQLWPRDQWALVRGARGENTALVLSPQLVLNFDQWLGTRTRFEARLQYAPWSSLYDRPDGDRRMPQAILSWPF